MFTLQKVPYYSIDVIIVYFILTLSWWWETLINTGFAFVSLF